MNTLDNLPSLPPHEMERIKKDMAAVDAAQQQEAQPEDLMSQLRPPEEQSQEVAQEPEQQEETPARKSGKESWREMREAKEAAEMRERELWQRMQALEAQLQRQNAPQQQAPVPSEENEPQLAPDALAEGKHVSSIYKKMRQMEDRIKQYEQKTQQNLVEGQLKAQFPDFDSVVSKSNLEELRRKHPHVAQAIATAATQDAYSAAATAYTLIKDMGIDRSSQEVNMTRRMLQENSSKPRSAQSAAPLRGNTPISKATEYMYDGKMTPEYQEQLLKEMYDARMRSR